MQSRTGLRVASLVVVAGVVGGGVVVGCPSASADGHTKITIKDGYYAALGKVKSADVELHIKKHGTQTTDLALVCPPVDPSLTGDSASANIAVSPGMLKVKKGKLSFTGEAVVRPAGDETQTGSSTLVLKLHHVNGPVFHYTYHGQHLSETTAWKGRVSSPACSSVGDDGRVTLFGPVPGE